MRNKTSYNTLLLSYSQHTGGAAKSADRLFASLRKLDVDACLLVSDYDKEGFQNHIFLSYPRYSHLLFKLSKNFDIHYPRIRYPALKKTGLFSPALFGMSLLKIINTYQPKIVHLHWVNFGMIRPESLCKLNVPIVWTLHDMWPMTGGCHYSGNCDRFTATCGFCPILNSQKELDMSFSLLRRKSTAWKNLDLHLVAPSRWMAEMARASALFKDRKINIIPYGVDIERYTPMVKKLACNDLRLDPDKRYLAFAAMNPSSDPRKGFQHAMDAIKRLTSNSEWREPIHLLVMGCKTRDLPTNLPCPATALGHVNEEDKMAKWYAAADLFLAPSVEDNLPNTVLESMACGTPVVAFNIGGMPDMIDHLENGYLANPRSAVSLAQGIDWVFNQNQESIRFKAREKVISSFTLEKQAHSYMDLYQFILSK